MKKREYIEMLLQDTHTAGDKKGVYNDIIDCVEYALAQIPDDFDVDGSVGLEDLFEAIKKEASKNRHGNCGSVGPFRAADIIAQKLGTSYTRASLRKSDNNIVRLEDLL